MTPVLDLYAAAAAATVDQYIEFTGDTIVHSDTDIFIKGISLQVVPGARVVFRAPTVTLVRSEVRVVSTVDRRCGLYVSSGVNCVYSR